MKKIVSVLMIACLISTLFLNVAFAQMNTVTSDTWSINYIPGAPASVSNQADWATTGAYSGDYQAYCASYNGNNGCGIKINIVNGSLLADNGRNYVLLTNTGNSIKWHLLGSFSYGDNVNTRLEAFEGYNLVANGNVHFVN